MALGPPRAKRKHISSNVHQFQPDFHAYALKHSALKGKTLRRSLDDRIEFMIGK